VTPQLDKRDHGVPMLSRDVDDASARGSHHGAVMILKRIFAFCQTCVVVHVLTVSIERARFQEQTSRLCVKDLRRRCLRCAVRALKVSHNQMSHYRSCKGG
jgi:hypothetical protein